MNKKWKQKWIEALFSGKYKQQIQGNGIPFCSKRAGIEPEWNVFGVLLNEMDASLWRPVYSHSNFYHSMDEVPDDLKSIAVSFRDHIAIIYCYSYLGSTSDLPEKLFNKLELKKNNECASLCEYKMISKISTMNYHNHSFKEIAQFIEGNML